MFHTTTNTVTASASLAHFSNPQTYRGNAIILPTVFEQVYVGQELRCFARASDLPKGSSMSAALERAGREPFHLGTSTSSSNREGIVELVIACHFASPGVHELVVRCMSASNREVLKKVYRLDATPALNCLVEREGDRVQFMIENVTKDLVLNLASTFGGEREDEEEDDRDDGGDYLVLPGESKYFLLSDSDISPTKVLGEDASPAASASAVSTTFQLRWVSQFGERGELKLRLPPPPLLPSSLPPLKLKLGQPQLVPLAYRDLLDKCSLVVFASDYSSRNLEDANAFAAEQDGRGEANGAPHRHLLVSGQEEGEVLYVLPIRVGLEGEVFVSI